MRLSASLLFKGEQSPPQGPIVCRTQEKKKLGYRARDMSLQVEQWCLRRTDGVIMTEIKAGEKENRWIIKVEDGMGR